MLGGERTAEGDVHAALTAALREERLTLVSSVIRVTGDWDLAEDALADAVERALVRWRRDGIPDSPAAWLTTTARRRAVDLLRRAGVEQVTLARVAGLLRGDGAASATGDGGGETVADDRLRLIFTCCHPALALPSRVALTLRMVCGLSTAAIARVFLISETAMSARLVRAKRKICHAAIPYQVPTRAMLRERADAVHAVVYLVFTAGYAAAADDALADEAIRLGRLLVALLPTGDEATCLLALMLLQHARRSARRGRDGELVTLENQNRTRWDRAAIAEARDLLARPVADRGRGPYRVQAEIAAVHAMAERATDTDWDTILARYDELLDLSPTPVVALNRAIAVGMARGPDAGLAELAEVAAGPVLVRNHLLPAAAADLLARSGRLHGAVDQLQLAVRLAPTPQERDQLRRQLADLARQVTPPSS